VAPRAATPITEVKFQGRNLYFGHLGECPELRQMSSGAKKLPSVLPAVSPVSTIPAIASAATATTTAIPATAAAIATTAAATAPAAS
jgi:hypothetical protein